MWDIFFIPEKPEPTDFLSLAFSFYLSHALDCMKLFIRFWHYVFLSFENLYILFVIQVRGISAQEQYTISINILCYFKYSHNRPIGFGGYNFVTWKINLNDCSVREVRFFKMHFCVGMRVLVYG